VAGDVCLSQLEATDTRGIDKDLVGSEDDVKVREDSMELDNSPSPDLSKG
jgi:hypothetical protein